MPATAADLPPELFPLILTYVCTDDRGRDAYRGDWVRDTMACSLVCRFWANTSRRALFDGRTVRVKSLAEFLTLDSFVDNGSTHLVPLSELISGLRIVQTWDSAAWCYRVCNSRLFKLSTVRSILEVPFYALTLQGPIPANLPRAAYRSLHWSLPRSLPDFYLPLSVHLRDVHFPRLSDLDALLGHFHGSSAVFGPRVSLTNVTCNDNDIPAVSFRRPFEQSVDELSALIEIHMENCTDDAHLGIWAYERLARPRPGLYMDDGESDAYVALARAMCGVDTKHGERAHFHLSQDCECIA